MARKLPTAGARPRKKRAPRATAGGTAEPAKVGIISLGCPKNTVDTEVLLGRIAEKHVVCADPADADIVEQIKELIETRVRPAVANDGGQLTGTPAYIALEYISQRVSSERSDIFSAGLVFYELLTGERAVPGNHVQQVMKRISSEDIRLPPATSSLFDERLVHLLHRALARDPEGRYESAAQMREALDDDLGFPIREERPALAMHYCSAARAGAAPA